MLLPLQGAIDDGYKTPRVSAHIVRLALGCVLLALQAVSFSMSIPISIDYALLALLAALFITPHPVFLIHQRAP